MTAIRASFGCCASTGKQSATSKALSSQNILELGILECWKNGFNRIGQHSIIPLFHHSGRLFDHFVRPRQHIWRNRQADLLRRLEIDHQLKLRRLLLSLRAIVLLVILRV
jgi:hypothetical protein